MPRSLDPMDLLFSSLSEFLDLSGNDIVCLPESIIQLSKLKWVVLDNCTSLRSLPKLPLNIESIYAEANGKRMSPALGSSLIPKVLPDHLWLLYVTPQFFDEKSNKLLSEGDANGFTQIGIKIEIGGPGEEVKKCGFRMIYNKDIEDLDRTLAQHSNINISPYESFAMIVECDKAKRSCDDYDGVGLSGEGSSNDISNPKRMKRQTETHGNSDCEELSEYKDCDEELSDWDESNEKSGLFAMPCPYVEVLEHKLILFASQLKWPHITPKHGMRKPIMQIWIRLTVGEYRGECAQLWRDSWSC
nr:hypothetical protein CFP56_32925 [Quercus suber]